MNVLGRNLRETLAGRVFVGRLVRERECLLLPTTAVDVVAFRWITGEHTRL